MCRPPRRKLAVLERDGARQGGAEGAVGVGDAVGEVDLVAVPDRAEGVGQQLVAEVAAGVLDLDPLDEVAGRIGVARARR